MDFLLFLLKGRMAYRKRFIPNFSSCLKLAGFDVTRESFGKAKDRQKQF